MRKACSKTVPVPLLVVIDLWPENCIVFNGCSKKKKINKRNNIAICRPTSMNCTICCLSSDIVCMFNEDLTLLSNAQSVYWPQRNRVPQFRGRNLANWKYKYYRNYSIVLTNEIKRFSIYVLISESHLSKFSFNRKTKTNKYVHHG